MFRGLMHHSSQMKSVSYTTPSAYLNDMLYGISKDTKHPLHMFSTTITNLREYHAERYIRIWNLFRCLFTHGDSLVVESRERWLTYPSYTPNRESCFGNSTPLNQRARKPSALWTDPVKHCKGQTEDSLWKKCWLMDGADNISYQL